MPRRNRRATTEAPAHPAGAIHTDEGGRPMVDADTGRPVVTEAPSATEADQAQE